MSAQERGAASSALLSAVAYQRAEGAWHRCLRQVIVYHGTDKLPADGHTVFGVHSFDDYIPRAIYAGRTLV